MTAMLLAEDLKRSKNLASSQYKLIACLENHMKLLENPRKNIPLKRSVKKIKKD